MLFYHHIFSAKALKIGVPIPQAKFWIAIANENSERAHKNSSAIGIWNKPNVDRIAKPSSSIKLPAINTGLNSEISFA